MATKYADRAFITVNGARISDIQSATLRMNHNRRVVPSMTRDRFNRGFVEGNIDIDITFVLAIQNNLARPKLEFIDYATADVAIQFECGAEVFTAQGCFNKDTDTAAGGIGDEVKSTFNFGALKLVDAVGDSALFNLVL